MDFDVSQLGATPARSSTPSSNPLGSLKTEDFLKILIAELSNQNPLDPMDNEKLLNQITSLTSVSTNTALVDTLKSFGSTQSLGSASSLIGKKVTGVVNDEEVTGVVDKATIEDGQVFLMIGENRLALGNVSEIG